MSKAEKELRLMTQEVAVHEATLYHVFNLSSAKDIKAWVCKRLGHPANRNGKHNTCFCGAKKRRVD
jgi:hypothetical protein